LAKSSFQCGSKLTKVIEICWAQSSSFNRIRPHQIIARGDVLTKSLPLGTGEVVGTLDGDLAHFLGSDFYEYLNNTLLILLGDHGNHMSPFYLWTRDGTIEHRLPALYLLFPRWFISRYPTIEENLRVNQQHLIVAHDIFSTLTALSQFPEFGHPTHTTDDIDKMIKVQSPHQLQDVFANNNRSFDSYPPWGLLGPLPNRTCAQVGIPTWHCICE
jgi:hypothetical protein